MRWTVISKRKRTPLLNWLSAKGLCRNYNRSVNFDYSLKNFIFAKGAWYIDENEQERTKKLLSKGLSDDKEFLKKLMESAYANVKKFDALYKKIKDFDISNASNKELRDFLLQYFNLLLQWVAYMQTTIIADRVIDEELNKLIAKKVPGDKIQNYLLLFTSPSKIGFFEQENEKLIEILKEIKESDLVKESDKLRKLLKKHLDEFGWFGNMEFDGKFWTKEDLILRLKSMINDNVDEIETKGIEKIRENKEKEIMKAINELGLTEEEISLVETARELVYFRTFRTDMIFKSGYKLRNLFMEVAKRMGISYYDIFYLFHEEILDFLDDKKINRKVLDERKKEYAISCIKGKLRELHGKEMLKLESEIKQEKIVETAEIKGSVASQGKVKGIAKIVNNVDDLSKVQKGDILISGMTKPDYIIAMEKAAAFVTDEGGITCHAAIISREMNKPCIIGTKVATKVLKDGDLVEVDAEKGVVRIIKK